MINFAVIGIKGFGKSHIRAIVENDDANLALLCDITEPELKAAAEQYHTSYTTDYDDVLANPDIDAVILAIPDQLHKDFAIKALRAGKHVLCEKPMSLDFGECKEMIKVADETGKYLMVGQICRFTPGFIKAKELVDSGEIGELFFVEGEYAHDYEGIDTPWRFDPKAPRHGLVGGGCHSIDLLRWIAGNPVEVFGYSNHKMLKDWPTDDCTVAIMKFPNDVIGKVFCSTGCKRNYTMRTVLYGSKGTIIVDNKSSYLSLFRESIDSQKAEFGSRAEEIELRLPVNVNNHNATAEVREFCNCILNGEPPHVDGREGATTVSICTAVLESVDKHMPVTVDYNMQ